MSAEVSFIAEELARLKVESGARQQEYRLAYWRTFADGVIKILESDISSDMKESRLHELRKAFDPAAGPPPYPQMFPPIR